MINNISDKNIFSSTLYVVPTPIGNLHDITHRALFVLRKVDFIAAEDTRRTSILLKHFSIKAFLFAFHEYNEKKKTAVLLSKLQLGASIALVSDAGTPLISDPGYCLVRACHAHGIRIVPLPGACAVITALSAAGLPTNRFCFEGFLPVKKQARISYFRTLLREPRTLVFYDSKYRIFNTLEDMVNVFGKERCAVIARELTKVWEFIYRASLQELLVWAERHTACIYGEIVLILEGCDIDKNELNLEVKRTIHLLAKELPFRKVVNLVVDIYGINKNIVYNYLLQRKRV